MSTVHRIVIVGIFLVLGMSLFAWIQKGETVPTVSISGSVDRLQILEKEVHTLKKKIKNLESSFNKLPSSSVEQRAAVVSDGVASLTSEMENSIQSLVQEAFDEKFNEVKEEQKAEIIDQIKEEFDQPRGKRGREDFIKRIQRRTELRLSEGLELNAHQEEEYKKIMGEYFATVQKLFSEDASKSMTFDERNKALEEARKKGDDKLRHLLTNSQYEKYKKNLENLKSNRFFGGNH